MGWASAQVSGPQQGRALVDAPHANRLMHHEVPLQGRHAADGPVQTTAARDRRECAHLAALGDHNRALGSGAGLLQAAADGMSGACTGKDRVGNRRDSFLLHSPVQQQNAHSCRALQASCGQAPQPQHTTAACCRPLLRCGGGPTTQASCRVGGRLQGRGRGEERAQSACQADCRPGWRAESPPPACHSIWSKAWGCAAHVRPSAQVACGQGTSHGANFSGRCLPARWLSCCMPAGSRGLHHTVASCTQWCSLPGLPCRQGGGGLSGLSGALGGMLCPCCELLAGT